jgi:hypothetical protein
MEEREVVLCLENEHLAFQWHADASARITDRSSGHVWHMERTALQVDNRVTSDWAWHLRRRSMCEEFPGYFRAEREGEGVRFTLLGRMHRELGTFRCTVHLDSRWLAFAVEEIDEELPSLIFPTPIASQSLVLPLGIGQWARTPIRERLFCFPFCGYTMRWFGGLEEDAGWIGILSVGVADAGVHATAFSASPAWLKSMGRWSGPREVRYSFRTGGYVALAKAYRTWAEEDGLVDTLQEKIEEIPQAAGLIGGPMVSIYQAQPIRRDSHEGRGRSVPPEVEEQHGGLRIGVTHSQAAAIVGQARANGMERGIVNVRGWIPGGYDNSHPDVWPPEPALGTADELKALLAQAPPVLGVLHDNYMDMYEQAPSFPHGIILTSKGEPLPAGVWAGGQAWLVCPRVALEYARRNWENMKALEPDGAFLDTTACQNLLECYHPDHPATRTDDMWLKAELLSHFRNQGLVVGSEEVSDFAAPVCHWFENRHSHIVGEAIPLWPLVFHDCAVCYRYSDPAGADPSGHGAQNRLADMLWGYSLLYSVRSPEQWEERSATFAAGRDVLEWHGRVGLDEMTDHRFLSEDCLLEQTAFASGASIACNFSGEQREVDGRTVEAGGYVILD